MRTQYRLTLEADLANLAKIRDFIDEAAAEINIASESVSEIRLAVDEAAANIIVHGYQDAKGTIDIEVRQEGNAVIIKLRDSAPQYNPLDAPEPRLDLPLEQRSLGGAGILLMKEYMDSVKYRIPKDGNNELVLMKTIR